MLHSQNHGKFKNVYTNKLKVPTALCALQNLEINQIHRKHFLLLRFKFTLGNLPKTWENTCSVHLILKL